MFTYISPWSPPPRWRGKEGTSRPPLSCCLPPFPSRETEPRSFFLFLPGLNKDLVGAENCISESELSFEAHRLGLSAFLGVGTLWRTPGATWVLAGGLGCKSQDTGHMDNAQGIHTCEPGRRPLLLFQHVAPTPDPCCDSKDWIGQTLGEKRKSGMARVSRVGSLRLGIELLQRSLRTALPQCPLGGVGQFS